MKKNRISLILIFALIYGCGTTKQESYPNYVLGIKEKNDKKFISKDSLNIVTPGIAIHYRIAHVSYPEYDKREIVKEFVIETLKSELSKTRHYDLALMSKDYRSVDEILEVIEYDKNMYPKWIVKAPDEILISEKKYTLLVNMAGRYGDVNNGVMYFLVINNEDKIIESVDRYDFNGSPLNNKQTQKRIKKALSKIISK